MSEFTFTSAQLERFTPASIIWLATVRANHSPHLTPIWFVVNEHRVYLCTTGNAVKARNIAQNPRVSLALEDGTNPFVIEGNARKMDADEVPDAVVEAFIKKYDWDIRASDSYDAVLEIIPEKILLGK